MKTLKEIIQETKLTASSSLKAALNDITSKDEFLWASSIKSHKEEVDGLVQNINRLTLLDPRKSRITEIIKDKTKILSSREMQVVQCIYFDQRTLQQTGDMMSLTRERVRQISQSAMQKIHALLSDKEKSDLQNFISPNEKPFELKLGTVKMNLSDLNSNTTVIGSTGSGKTSVIKNILKQAFNGLGHPDSSKLTAKVGGLIIDYSGNQYLPFVINEMNKNGRLNDLIVLENEGDNFYELMPSQKDLNIFEYAKYISLKISRNLSTSRIPENSVEFMNLFCAEFIRLLVIISYASHEARYGFSRTPYTFNIALIDFILNNEASIKTIFDDAVNYNNAIKSCNDTETTLHHEFLITDEGKKLIDVAINKFQKEYLGILSRDTGLGAEANVILNNMKKAFRNIEQDILTNCDKFFPRKNTFKVSMSDIFCEGKVVVFNGNGLSHEGRNFITHSLIFDFQNAAIENKKDVNNTRTTILVVDEHSDLLREADISFMDCSRVLRVSNILGFQDFKSIELILGRPEAQNFMAAIGTKVFLHSNEDQCSDLKVVGPSKSAKGPWYSEAIIIKSDKKTKTRIPLIL